VAPEGPRSPEDNRVIFDRYVLVELIGRGGLGKVWRAHDRRLGRTVAVKEVPPPAALNESSRSLLYQRLTREARAAAQLHHPNAVGLYDVVSDGDRLWIIMEYVPGRDLQQIISTEGPLTPARTARIGRQMLDALSAAHRAGVLHRDVKPSNIIITDDGRAVLSDFGIAQIEGDSTLTQAGQLIGTPAYIAPEIVAGGRATAASDLWSLGATLYAAVEGHPPFQRPTVEETLAALATEPAPRARRAEALAPVLEGLLERDPARRMDANYAVRLLKALFRSPPAADASREAASPEATDGSSPGEEPRGTPSPREPDGSPDELSEGAPDEPGGASPGPSDQTPTPPWLPDPDPRVWMRVPEPPEPASGAPPPAPSPYGAGAADGTLPPAPPPPPAPWAMPAERPELPEHRAPETPWGSTAPGPAPQDEPWRVPRGRARHPTGLSGLLRLLRGLPPWRSLRRQRSPAESVPPPALDIASGGMLADYGYVAASRLGLASAFYSPLRDGFRYVHEPLPHDETAIPLLGNERLIRELRERLTNSHGGTFLITGFRGVGKTTLVERALAELAAERSRDRRVVPVVLSVARPMATEKLLFAIVRRVFEELTEAGVLEMLPAATRQSLLLAYMRTSLSFKETRSDAWERAGNVELDAAKLAGGLLKPISLPIPKAGMSTKRSRSLATEAAFLAYSETDVEHDMMRIIRLLSSADARRPHGWRRLLPGAGRRHRPLDLELVVVLDEIDKLAALKEGLAEVERLLGGLKNVMTMRGAHYLVVAGPDLHDQVLRDSGRGNSIYESIFAWRLYVPCSWAAPARLLEHILRSPPGERDGGVIEEFVQYLRFKSRGVPRKLLQELNSFVVWEEPGTPYLRIGSQSAEAISFYALIERSLDDFFVGTARQVLPAALEQDRWRLGAYYVMDWILRSEGRPFTSADVMQAVDAGEFDPILRVSKAGVDMLLEHLGRQRVLDVVRGPAPETFTVIADVAAAQLPSYKLTDSLLAKLFRIVVHNEEERAEHDHTRTVLAAGGSGGGPIRMVGRRYELLRLIGEGGTSSVYEGRDVLLRRPVAVKMLRSSLTGDARARERFLREARIAEGVHHPNVVDVYEIVPLDGDQQPSGPPDDRDPPDPRDPQLAIVMEYLAAPTLRQLVRNNGPLPARLVVDAAITLAGALEYLADKGLARLDLKPHNIVMIPERGPVIIDLGIAKIVKNVQIWQLESDLPEDSDPNTTTGMIIGTPAYLAPEQIRGDDVDIRSDIYALGLVLYTCLAGRHPYEGQDLAAMVTNALARDLDTAGLPGSADLRGVIAQATVRDPAKRFQTPAELLAALRDTPEANVSPGAPPVGHEDG
jgi:serine/threonine protein kinase